MLGRYDALTGRRLGGALFVLCGLAVAVIVLWPSGAEPDRGPVKVQPVRLVSVPQLGFTFAHPWKWKRSLTGSVIRLRSPDRSTVLTFTSPTSGRHTRRVKSEIKAVLRRRFSPAKIVREGRGRLGTRRASTFELAGHGPEGQVRVLVVVANSRWRTYAVTVLTPIQPSARRLVEVQQMLATVRLVEPRRAPKL